VWQLWDRVDVAKAFGMIVTMLAFGGIVGPILVGYLLEASGSFSEAYYIMDGFSLVSAICFLILYKKEKLVKKLRLKMLEESMRQSDNTMRKGA